MKARKPIAAILVALLFLTSCFSACAETVLEVPAREQTFEEALPEFIANLSPAQYDITGALRLKDAGTYGASVRQDGDTLEIAVADLGSLQLSSEEIAFTYDGQGYIVRYADLLNMAQNVDIEGIGASFADDLQTLLELAARDIVQPSMSVTSYIDGDNGIVSISAHISISEDAFYENLTTFINDVLDTDIVDRYLPYFSQYIPDVDANALRMGWKAMAGTVGLKRALMLSNVATRGFSFDADVQIDRSDWLGTSLAFVGTLATGYNRCDFSLEFSKPGIYSSNSSAYLKATLDNISLMYATRSSRYSLTAKAADDELTAAVEVDGETLLTADSRVYSDSLDASVTIWENGAPSTCLTLSGYDVMANVATFTLDKLDYDSDADVAEEPARLATLTIDYSGNPYAATLTTGAFTTTCTYMGSSPYWHASVELVERDAYRTAVDLWLFRNSWTGYRARCAYTYGYRGRTLAKQTITAALLPNGVEFAIADTLRGTKKTGSVSYTPLDDGFAFDLSYSDNEMVLVRGYDVPPYALHVQKNGNLCEASLSYTTMPTTYAADFSLVLGETGGIDSAEGTITTDRVKTIIQQNADAAETAAVVEFAYVPGRLTMTSESETVTIEKVEVSGSALVYKVSGANVNELLRLEINQNRTGFSARLIESDELIAELTLKASEKTGITKVDPSNAIVIDQTLIGQLIGG